MVCASEADHRASTNAAAARQLREAGHAAGMDESEQWPTRGARTCWLLLSTRERSPAATLELTRGPDWTKGRALVRAGNARRRQDRQGRVSPPAARRPRDLVPRGTCDHAPGSDASSIRNDTPSAAAVEHVLWTRRRRAAGAPAADSIVTGATQRLSISWWSWPLGHFVGPNPAVLSRIKPNTGHLRSGRFSLICRHFVAWVRRERHASHARGRWFETSRTHPRSGY
jgi:hypothetical protein